jgi:transposase
MVLLSAQGMSAAGIARVAFTSEDRFRDVIRNFNADGYSSLYPKYRGGHPPKFTLGQRREIKKITKSRPVERGPVPPGGAWPADSTWSLSKLAEFCRRCGSRSSVTTVRIFSPHHGGPNGTLMWTDDRNGANAQSRRIAAAEILGVAPAIPPQATGDQAGPVRRVARTTKPPRPS